MGGGSEGELVRGGEKDGRVEEMKRRVRSYPSGRWEREVMWGGEKDG